MALQPAVSTADGLLVRCNLVLQARTVIQLSRYSIGCVCRRPDGCGTWDALSGVRDPSRADSILRSHS